MTGSGRFGAALTLALGLALSMTACGSASSSAPHSLPPLAPATTQPAVQPPTPSPTARPQSPKAAVKAVVTRYFNLLEHVATQMKPHPFEVLMTRGCTCQKFPKVVRRLNARHERFFGRAKLLAMRPTLEGASAGHVLVTFNSTRGGIINDSGRTVSTVKPLKLVSLDYQVRLVGTRWLIYRIISISPGTA